MAGSTEKLRWYFTNLPLVSTSLIVTILICYKIRLDRNFSDVALCVQPHMVLTGQVSRLIKYVVHHKNVYHLLLSIGSLAIFGTTAERQAGSFRFLWLMTVFSVLSGVLTVLFSILLGFSSLYSSLMYRYLSFILLNIVFSPKIFKSLSCPALGLMPGMFAIMVLVFKSYPLKMTVFLFLMIPNSAMPWILLILSQIITQDNMFIGNLCGCIIGSIYLRTSKSISVMPLWVVKVVDKYLVMVFKFIPLIRYIPGTAEELPVYNKSVASVARGGNYQTDDYVVRIKEDSVQSYKVNKLTQMGFEKEESIVALTAANHDIEQAVSILSNGQVGPQASVVPMPS